MSADFLDTSRGFLTDTEVAAAMDANVKVYKSSVKSMTDLPVPNQGLALISHMFFDQPKMSKSGKPIYGFEKVRGNYPGSVLDAKLAKEAASTIIREQDSKFPIRIIPVGTWVPITPGDDFVEDKLDVRMNKDDATELHLRDEAAKDAEAKQRQIARELREKEERVRNYDIYDDRESLDFYTMKRVAEMHLRDGVATLQAKLEDVTNKLNTVMRECKTLDSKHPEYENKWIERYNEERVKSGIPTYVESEAAKKAYAEWSDKQ